MDEAFDGVLTPGCQRIAPETTAKAAHTREADAADLDRVTIEHGDTRIAKNLRHLILFAGLEVMTAQDCGDGNAQRRGDLFSENVGLLGLPVIRQVATEQEKVGVLGYLGEKLLKRAV